ncbi:type IV secretory system conjugative DNA transfer family protein [Heyndrickxia oleronia]|uniref:type IV secretory system conjugative DNA transfer family protein n=1 Tax=Heyndrickxia oleronia TaxID=38875 RepID=UPI00203EF5B0|nr:type IV secretory system conjugative DNA transfer family protein [Heyndrickxia oleronia]MCM3240764.1 type IV secretory system conjugative DNA transfer family protein [Heyndrickxia oleronia]
MNTIAQHLEKKNLRWGGDDPFTHTLIIGPTRCGKTATIIKPIIYQILDSRRKGRKVGLSVIEPKGDVAAMVKETCDWMGEDCIHIDPNSPTSDRINVMQGEKDDVAEATVAVLKSLFGKQEAFFATVQELSTRKITLLLKELYGDNMDITDVLTNLRDQDVLMKNVYKLQQKQGDTELVKFFVNELMGSLKDKYNQLIIGLRAQMENITSNEKLKRIITGNSTFSIDEHFENGGILAVNTALGSLGKAGDAFGQFVTMHLQLGTFRRKGTERTRIDHYFIIDEYSRYINPDVERWLSISAEYRVAGMFAIQSPAQLEVEAGQISGKAMKQAIMTSTRNKIIFGGLAANDAIELARELGQDRVVYKDKSFDGNPLKNIIPKGYRIKEEDKDRYPYTLLMDGLPRFHFVHKLLQQGHPQPPGIAVGGFVPRDWKEQLVREDLNLTNNKSSDSKRGTFNKEIKKEDIFSVNPFNDPINTEETGKVLISFKNQETSLGTQLNIEKRSESMVADLEKTSLDSASNAKNPIKSPNTEDDDFW